MSFQIPNLHTSNKSKAKAEAEVFIARRKDATHSGIFSVRGTVGFPGADGYPVCNLTIKADLNDSAKGDFMAKTAEQVDTTGGATPTIFVTGRCRADAERNPKGCRFW